MPFSFSFHCFFSPFCDIRRFHATLRFSPPPRHFRRFAPPSMFIYIFSYDFRSHFSCHHAAFLSADAFFFSPLVFLQLSLRFDYAAFDVPFIDAYYFMAPVADISFHAFRFRCRIHIFASFRRRQIIFRRFQFSSTFFAFFARRLSSFSPRLPIFQLRHYASTA
jgi:hypothetical protein